MSERVWAPCRVCGADLTAILDLPAIREAAIRCPYCVDLAVTMILERNQPRNPYTNAVPEDPEGWRVQSVLAGVHTPQCVVCTHQRRSRRQARRRHGRRGR